MAFGEFYVQRECWAKWPKVLWMVRKQGDGDERRRYLPERTCRNVSEWHDVDEFVCSECGIKLRDWSEVWEDEEQSCRFEYAFKFCPMCGAKVVEE